MCGRYTLAAAEAGALRKRFPLGEAVEVRSRFNIAPGDPVLAVTSDRDGGARGELLRWGLVPPWASSPRVGLKLINARAETAAERPAFRGSLQRSRCLIIADGFYEWGRDGAAYWITRADRRPFAFAGLWSRWRDPGAPDGASLRSCTILTTDANARIAPLHGRMPVILDPGAERPWLDPATPLEHLPALLAGLGAEATLLTPVGPAVGDARHDAPDCLAPPPAPQPTLF